VPDPRRVRGLWVDLINLAAGAAFVWSGAADRSWRAVEPAMPWRTGPAFEATLLYLALCAAGWAGMNWILAAALRTGASTERIVLRAGRFVVASAVVVVIQVLALPVWPAVAILILLPPSLLAGSDGTIVRRVLAWAWVATGICLAGLLFHPWFLGRPEFIPRLAVCLTAWRLVGGRMLRTAHPWTPDWLP
jgi:hypothetical protein